MDSKKRMLRQPPFVNARDVIGNYEDTNILNPEVFNAKTNYSC